MDFHNHEISDEIIILRNFNNFLMIERGLPRCFHKRPNTCERVLYVRDICLEIRFCVSGPELINERISINPFVFFKHDRRELIGININSCVMGLVPLLVALLYWI